ncbi:MAG: hypothetical protein AAF683_01420 [Pseudomonadota bacterium]
MARSNRSSRSRFGKRSRRGKGNNRGLKVFAALLMLVSVLGLGGYGLTEYMKIEQIGAGFCYARADQAEAAVFLDYSVHLNMSAAQRRDMMTALERAYDALPVNGRIMVFTTARDAGGSIARPVYEQCRPAKSVAEQAAIGAPSKPRPNLERIAMEARLAFWGQLDRILADSHDSAKAAHESPLLANLQAISRYPGFQGQRRSLVWLSDGIENSETAQFCAVKGDMPRAATFVTRPGYGAVRPESFAGVDVTLLLVESIALPSPGLEFCRHAEMRAWWPEYLRLNGAERVRLERLRRGTGS